jgi:hypothetical protein
VVVEISESQGRKHIYRNVSISNLQIRRTRVWQRLRALVMQLNVKGGTAYLRISASILTAEEVVWSFATPIDRLLS